MMEQRSLSSFVGGTTILLYRYVSHKGEIVDIMPSSD